MLHIVIENLKNSKVLDIYDTHSLVQVNKSIYNNLLDYHKNLILIKKIIKFTIIPCTFSEWVTITDYKSQAHEYSQEYYSDFFQKPFSDITNKEIGLLNSFIWLNTDIKNSKQFRYELSKYYRIHSNGLIRQIPNLQNYVSGDGPYLNIRYCYSENPKLGYTYISDINLYVDLYLDTDSDDINLKVLLDKIKQTMKLIILQKNKLSYYERIYNLFIL